MAIRPIFAWQDEQHDPTRWLAINASDSGDVTLDITDLCQPGRTSGLTHVSLPLGYLQSALNNGAVQISQGKGYFAVRRRGDTLQIEFRSADDASGCQVHVRADEVRDRLIELTSRGNVSVR